MGLKAQSKDNRSLLTVDQARHEYVAVGQARRGLFDVSFDVALGEWALLLGSNGAGKSTLLNAICGSLSLQRGEIVLDGQSISRMTLTERAKRVALVRQDPLLGTASTLTVAEHLALADPQSEFLRPLSRQRRLKLGAFIEDGALHGRLDQITGSLSGGERQLLTVILARLRGARLLLIDEGFSALDRHNANQCLELVGELVGRLECGALMVTHDFHFASQCGHRLLVMREGRLVFDSSSHSGPRLTAEELWQLATVEGVS